MTKHQGTQQDGLPQPGRLDPSASAKRVLRSVRRRRRFERCFRAFGLLSVCLGLFSLAAMLVKIGGDGLGAFQQTYIYLEIEFEPKVLAMTDPSDPEQLAIANFGGLIEQAMQKRFPGHKSRAERRALRSLVSSTATFTLRELLVSKPELMRESKGLWLLADDDVDIYRKTRLDPNPVSQRLDSQQVEWIETMIENEALKARFNVTFFTAGDSSEPESAGILGALMGSVFTLAITLVLSFPIGVATAIYLEEYAPKNKFTDFLEININNLAAVPSVIFGLLGLAIFLNIFGMPRSIPLVGGMVLTLMTLPTVIISSRAAIKSVPQSIRNAAYGLGASKMQVIVHHIMPIALPGMLTGAILGMAQALGETAPLLMIGMVAFIVDVPTSALDPATVLPVQIFLWADAPERSFVEKSSAAIVVLLVFLLAMNLIAILLRKSLRKRL